MSFGAMFAGFVDGVESGYKFGTQVREKRDTRNKSDDELTRETNRRMAQEDEERAAAAAMTDGSAPVPPRRPEGFAEGGLVDTPAEDGTSAAQYFTAERQQAVAQGRTPPADPIKGALDWFSSLGRDRAVADDPKAAEEAAAAVKEVIPAPGTHLDTTTMVGGISQVVGRTNNRPFTFADHVRFLDTYNKVARERNVDPNQAMKFNVQYLDNLRHVAQRTFALGAAAWDSGDTNAVQAFVKQGMGLVPDGMGVKTKFVGDKLHVQQFNEGTGKDIGKPIILDKQGYMRMAGTLTGSSLAFGQYLRQTEDERAVALAGAKARAQAEARGAAGTGRQAKAPPSDFMDSIKSADATAFGKELQRLNVAGVPRARADAIYQALEKNTTPAQAAEVVAKINSREYALDSTGAEGPGIYDRASGRLVKRVNPKLFANAPAKDGAAPAPQAGTPPAATPAGRQPPQPTRAPPAREPTPAPAVSTTPQAPGPISAQAAPASTPGQAIPTGPAPAWAGSLPRGVEPANPRMLGGEAVAPTPQRAREEQLLREQAIARARAAEEARQRALRSGRPQYLD